MESNKQGSVYLVVAKVDDRQFNILQVNNFTKKDVIIAYKKPAGFKNETLPHHPIQFLLKTVSSIFAIWGFNIPYASKLEDVIQPKEFVLEIRAKPGETMFIWSQSINSQCLQVMRSAMLTAFPEQFYYVVIGAEQRSGSIEIEEELEDLDFPIIGKLNQDKWFLYFDDKTPFLFDSFYTLYKQEATDRNYRARNGLLFTDLTRYHLLSILDEYPTTHPIIMIAGAYIQDADFGICALSANPSKCGPVKLEDFGEGPYLKLTLTDYATYKINMDSRKILWNTEWLTDISVEKVKNNKQN